MLSVLSVGVTLLLVSTDIALASLPDPTLSSVDPVLIGSAGGVVEGTRYTVVVRHVTGTPLPGKLVTIHFGTASGNPGSAASPQLYDSQLAPVSVDCQGQVLSQLSGPTGVATFFAHFGGAENGASVVVSAFGVPLKRIKVRSTDLNSNGSTDLPDFGIFGDNFFNNPAAAETDFNDSGSTELADFAIFGAEFFSGASGTPCI